MSPMVTVGIGCALSLVPYDRRQAWPYGHNAATTEPSFPVTVAPDELVTRLKTKNAWAVAAEEGYHWGNVRFGIDVSYQKHDINGIQFISADGVPITPADVEDIKAALIDAGVLTA